MIVQTQGHTIIVLKVTHDPRIHTLEQRQHMAQLIAQRAYTLPDISGKGNVEAAVFDFPISLFMK